MAIRRPKGENISFKTMLFIAAYLLAVLLLFALVDGLCTFDTVQVKTETPGLLDLTAFNFTNQIARTATVHSDSIVIYSGAFYTSEDFAAGNVTAPGVLRGAPDDAQGDYGTLRMVLRLPPGQMYAIAAKNASYAQRLFIDGIEYGSVGVPGDSAETTVPKTTRYIEGFAPTGETTEIIIHYANFVHADDGGVYPIDVGTVENILHSEQLWVIRTAAVAAALGVALLFFTGLFLLFPKNRYLLWFGLLCGCAALRELVLNNKAIMLLFPGLDWYAAIRLEYLLTVGMVLFSVLYLHGLFPGRARRRMLWGCGAVCLGASLFILLTPPLVFTRYPTWILLGCVLFLLFMLLSVLADAARGKLRAFLSTAERFLLLAGLVLYVALTLAGIFAHGRSLLILGLDYPHLATVAFLFINMLALVMGFARTGRELSAVRESEREIRETNRMLERLSRARADFLGNISHEMKTPLAVISSYAGLTISQLQKNAVNEQTEVNLDRVQQEAVRLGRLVEQLMKGSLEKERQLTLTPTHAGALLERAAAFCEPICRGRNNRITVECHPAHIPLRVNRDAIFQVLLNLITNANRQMQKEVISLSARTDGERRCVVFEVTDRGRGIPPELLEHVFERGISGDGGTGLGLAICKEIVQEHGGGMELQSGGIGTMVRFTLPCAEGGNQS